MNKDAELNVVTSPLKGALQVERKKLQVLKKDR